MGHTDSPKAKLGTELLFRVAPNTGLLVESLRVCALVAPPEHQTKAHNLHVEAQDLAERIVTFKNEVLA